MKCSFCNKDQEEVHKLIAASDKIAICDGCVLDALATLIYPDEVTVIELEEENYDESEIQTSEGC